MEELVQKLPEIFQIATPEVMVVVFTIIGALASSIIEIRKRRKLKTLQVAPASDAAFELAKKALEQVEKAAEECNKKFIELSEKYEALESKYHRQIEISTKQAEMISKLNIELLYFRTQIEAEFIENDPIEPEDKDPGY